MQLRFGKAPGASAAVTLGGRAWPFLRPLGLFAACGSLIAWVRLGLSAAPPQSWDPVLTPQPINEPTAGSLPSPGSCSFSCPLLGIRIEILGLRGTSGNVALLLVRLGFPREKVAETHLSSCPQGPCILRGSLLLDCSSPHLSKNGLHRPELTTSHGH